MEFIDELERTKARTIQYFDLAGEDLEKTYAPEKRSVRYLLNQLADSETVLFYRAAPVTLARLSGALTPPLARSACLPAASTFRRSHL